MSSQPTAVSITPPARAAHVPGAVVVALVLLALAIKVAFVVYLDGRVYPDVLKIVNYGALVARGTFSIQTHIINDKTFIGPLLWWPVYDHAGVAGLLTTNFIAFLGLCGVHFGFGRRHDAATRTIAFVLFAFYVGTHRNIVAGEPDDNVGALLFGLGILIYLETRRTLAAALCLGVGFLFKFSVAIFGAGFAAYLVWRRAWRALGWALFGMGLPFLGLNVIDGLNSFHALFASLGIQHGYTSWDGLVSKSLSTGLAPMVIVATWAWRKRRDDVGTLFWLLSIAYPVYALLNRDAFAATFVMMISLLPASFLLAEACIDAIDRLPRAWHLTIAIGTLAAYVVATTAVTHLNLYRDTTPIVMVHTDTSVRDMFPYND